MEQALVGVAILILLISTILIMSAEYSVLLLAGLALVH